VGGGRQAGSGTSVGDRAASLVSVGYGEFSVRIGSRVHFQRDIGLRQHSFEIG